MSNGHSSKPGSDGMRQESNHDEAAGGGSSPHSRRPPRGAEVHAPISLQSLAIPFPAHRNPLGDAAEAQVEDIARRVGLLSDGEVPRYRGFSCLPGYVYPSAPLERLVACCQWSDWQFFFDDECDDNKAFGRDLDKLRILMETYVQILREGTLPPDAGSLAHFTIDLRQRLLGLSSPSWLGRFVGSAEDYLLHGSLLAVRNWRDDVVPDVETYLAQRENDAGVYPAIDMIEIAAAIELPAAVFADPFVQRMRRLCTRVVAYANDVVSYQKEVLRKQNPNNLLHVLMVHRPCSFAAAAEEAFGIINADVQEFILSRKQAPAFPPDVALMLEEYLDGMEHWMRGNIEWSLASGRYKAPDSPFEELRTPALPQG